MTDGGEDERTKAADMKSAAKAIQTLLAKRIKSADNLQKIFGNNSKLHRKQFSLLVTKLCSTAKEQISQDCIQAAWSMATENATAATTIDFVRMKSWLQFNDL